MDDCVTTSAQDGPYQRQDVTILREDGAITTMP